MLVNLVCAKQISHLHEGPREGPWRVNRAADMIDLRPLKHKAYIFMHYSLNLDSRDRVDRGHCSQRRRGPEEGFAADSAEHNRTATGATYG
jgi:hypothetical protein